MAAKYECASFAGDGMTFSDLVVAIESRIGCYATDDYGTAEPYVTTRHSEIVVEYHDEQDVGLIPWELSREVEVPWGLSYLIRTWYATLVRGERVSGCVFRATYKIEVEK